MLTKLKVKIYFKNMNLAIRTASTFGPLNTF